MQVLNKTHYHSFMTRLYNDVAEPNSFSYESSKRSSYQQRLYFEYLYTQKVGGVSFFITFTYNDNAIPQWHGHNVFDYEHVRLITNGKISKVLMRKYHAQMKYFCACETGDGKGERGLGNNPHYHFIFYIQPLDSNFVKPTPDQFISLCRSVWQYRTVIHPIYGTRLERYCDWRSARFGHVQAGNNQGVINSADAFGYVSKYCTKSSFWNNVEREVIAFYDKVVTDNGYTFPNCLLNYYEYLKDLGYYNAIDSPRYAFLRDSGLLDFAKYRRTNDWAKKSPYQQTYRYYLLTYRNDLLDTFTQPLIDYYYNTYKELAVKTFVRKWKNRYGLKTRMSNGVGLYGLEFVKNKESNPTISYITSKDCKDKPLCLYLYRKLYMDVVKCPVTGNPLYILNSLGLQLKHNQLPSQINTTIDTLKQAIIHFNECRFNNLPVYNRYYDSIRVPRETIPDNAYYAYAVYTLVYKHRHFKDELECNLRIDIDIEDVLKDYDKYLLNTYWSLDYDEISLKQRIYTNRDHLVAFTSHYAFVPYARYFDYFDKVTDAFRSYVSVCRKVEFETKMNDRAVINRYKFNNK